MAQATTATVSKKLIKITLVEARALRNLLGRVKKGQKGKTIANLHSIRKALTAQGIAVCRQSVLKGTVTSTDRA